MLNITKNESFPILMKFSDKKLTKTMLNEMRVIFIFKQYKPTAL